MSGRGYLAQLAEPVPAGSPVLAPRRDGQDFQAPVEAPVAQDASAERISTAPTSLRRKAAPVTQRSAAAVSAAEVVAPGSAAVSVKAQTHLGTSIEAGVDAARFEAAKVASDVPQSRTRQAASERAPMEAVGREDVVRQPSMADVRDVREHPLATFSRSEEPAVRVEAERTITEHDSKPAVVAPSEPVHERNFEDARVKAEPASVVAPEARVRAPLMELPSFEQSKVSAGPRVRIGTIEVRTTVPPAQPVAAAAQRIENIAHRNEAHVAPRAAAGGPLARDLAWTYGLVQG